MQKKKRNRKKNRLLLCIAIVLITITASCVSNFIEKRPVQYEGKGVTIVAKQDGYTTTFTTADKKIYKEYKQGQNASWANMPYWDNQMWDNGCGITCISILATGYGNDITPEDLRKKYYPHLDGDKIPQAIEELEIECTEFMYYNTYLSKEYLIDWLKTERPVLICVTNKPMARWTKSSHYMLLLATDGKDRVYVSNPNEADGNNKSSGWYSISEVTPYLAKALFIKD